MSINCNLLQIKLKKSSPENMDILFDFLNENTLDFIINNEELSDKEKYILIIYKIAEKYDCDLLDLYISLIAKQSDNLEKCVIDANEKIFNALKLLIPVLKKVGMTQDLFNAVVNQNSFISKALRKLQENYEEEIATYEIEDADEELITEKEKIKSEFKEKYDKIINSLMIFGENSQTSQKIETQKIDLSPVNENLKILDEKINALEEKINNIPDLINNALSSVSFEGNGEISIDLSKIESDLQIINENIKTLEENIINKVVEILDEKLNPILTIKEQLKDVAEKMTEKIENATNDLAITTDGLKAWEISINDIKRDVKSIDEKVKENQTKIETINKTINEEIERANVLYEQKCGTKK